MLECCYGIIKKAKPNIILHDLSHDFDTIFLGHLLGWGMCII
jgi:hypothetical protein